jgi:hypothetical protein
MSLCRVSRFIYCYAECHYAECRYAECRNDECRGAPCLTLASEVDTLLVSTLAT